MLRLSASALATLVVALLSFGATPADAQFNVSWPQPPQCVPFNTTWAGAAAVCALYPGMQDFSFYAPNDFWDSTAFFFYFYASGIITALQAFTNIPPRCRDLLFANLCSLLFRPCVVHEGEMYVFPQEPCRWVCEEIFTECTEYGEKTGLTINVLPYYPPGNTPPTTCNETDPHNNGGFLFNERTYTAEIAPNVTVELQCNDYNGTFISTPCYAPLEYNPDNGYCAFSCPLPSYTDDEYDSAKLMQAILGWFSWALTIFMIVSYAINPKLRAFPSNLVIMTAVALHVVSLGVILPSLAGHETVWCGEDTQYTKQPDIHFELYKPLEVDYHITDLQFKSGSCTFQGALLHFGLVAATFWWGIIAFNMFLQIFFVVTKVLPILATKRSQIILQVVYAVVGWGVPFLLMVVPAAADKFSFTAGATYCFISPEDDNAWNIAFWFVPVGIVLVTGSLFFMVGMAQVLRLCILSMKDKSSRTVRKAIPLFLRLLLFVFIFWMLYVCIFSYRIAVESEGDDISDAYDAYLLCLSTSGVPSALIWFQLECELDEDAKNYELAMVQGFSVAALGVFLFVAFLSVEMFRHWGRLAVAAYKGVKGVGRGQGFFSSLVHVLRTGTSSSTGSSHTGSKMTITSHISTTADEGDEDDTEDEEEGAASTSEELESSLAQGKEGNSEESETEMTDIARTDSKEDAASE